MVIYYPISYQYISQPEDFASLGGQKLAEVQKERGRYLTLLMFYPEYKKINAKRAEEDHGYTKLTKENHQK